MSGEKTLREIGGLNIKNNNKKFPGDGFEPPLEEPESSVLPLDDPGTLHIYFITKNQMSNLQFYFGFFNGCADNTFKLGGIYVIFQKV